MSNAAPAGLIGRISWRLLPIIGLSYLIAFVDRTNLSFASVSMNTDLGFSQAVYGTGVAAFFIGYSLFEVPSNLMLDRFGARRWIARIMFTWGLLSIAMIFVNAAWNFYLLRFLLGVAEAGFYPGVVHYLSHWLPAIERGRAISRFYIAAPLGNIVMGALAAPLLSLLGVAGLAGWQWLLLLEGLPALIMAAVVLIALPDSPDRAAWLSAEDKQWLGYRLAADAAASGGHGHSLLRALLDPLVLTMGGATAFLFMCNGAIGFSAPKLLIAAHGWTMATAGAIVALGGLCSAVALLIVGPRVDRAQNPFPLMAGLAAISLTGALIMAWGGGFGLTAIGFLIFVASNFAAGMLGCLLVSRFVHPAARAAGLAMTNSIAQLGAFCGPLLWGFAADQTGSFDFGLKALAPLLLVAVGLSWLGGQVRAGRQHQVAQPA